MVPGMTNSSREVGEEAVCCSLHTLQGCKGTEDEGPKMI